MFFVQKSTLFIWMRRHHASLWKIQLLLLIQRVIHILRIVAALHSDVTGQLSCCPIHLKPFVGVFIVSLRLPPPWFDLPCGTDEEQKDFKLILSFFQRTIPIKFHGWTMGKVILNGSNSSQHWIIFNCKSKKFLQVIRMFLHSLIFDYLFTHHSLAYLSFLARSSSTVTFWFNMKKQHERNNTPETQLIIGLSFHNKNQNSWTVT